MSVCRHICLCAIWIQCPKKLEQGISPPRAGVKDGCKSLCGCWELMTGPLEEQASPQHLKELLMLCLGIFRMSLGLFHFESSFSILFLLLNISLYITNIFIMQTDVISVDYNLKALKTIIYFYFMSGFIFIVISTSVLLKWFNKIIFYFTILGVFYLI